VVGARPAAERRSVIPPLTVMERLTPIVVFTETAEPVFARRPSADDSCCFHLKEVCNELQAVSADKATHNFDRESS
jgi:hypothetical protein